MKKVHLISIVDAYTNLKNDLFEKYLEYVEVWLKPREREDLAIFTKSLYKSTQYLDNFDHFYLDYSIPQISKQFDLLRFGKDSIINIELKATHTGNRINKQLEQNLYYLSFLEKPIDAYTFVCDEKQLYKLNVDKKLEKVDLTELVQLLENQEIEQIADLDSLFNPSNYLVSPFNSTERFIQDEYFLTDQQKNIKQEVLESIEVPESTFASISGKAGTGKTLLAYDIAKSCMDSVHKVLILHCGKLNQGHALLRDVYGWDIVMMRDYHTKTLSEYSLIVVDEAQRGRPYQIKSVIQVIKDHNLNCIFSLDEAQCITAKESESKIKELIKTSTSPIEHELTKKIRTNKEIASFIRSFFNRNIAVDRTITSENIELHYFKSSKGAKLYAHDLQEAGWKVINYTSDRKRIFPYDSHAVIGAGNTHEIYGQEFDKVVAIIDSHFYYNGRNQLATQGYDSTPHYRPNRMLFQIVTRTRRKLSLIIINNPEIMNRCLEILNPVIEETVEQELLDE